MKIAIYTCNIGSYDRLTQPKAFDPRVDYLYFTDGNAAPARYTLVKTDAGNKSAVRVARSVKILSHLFLKGYDATIWHDACFSPAITDAAAFIERALCMNDIAMFKHCDDLFALTGRDCTYDEAAECLKQRLDDPAVIAKQIARYRAVGFKEHAGLHATGVIVRKKTAAVEAFEKVWWKEICIGSHRDQLSQEYAAWRTKVGVKKIVEGGENIYSNLLFVRKKHIK